MMHLSDIRAWLWLWSGASVRLVLLCRWLNLTQRTWKASNKVTAPTHTIRIHFSLSQSNKLPFIHSHWHIHSAFTITIAQPWEKLTPILPPLSWSSGTRLATKATTFTQTLAKSLWTGTFVSSYISSMRRRHPFLQELSPTVVCNIIDSLKFTLQHKPSLEYRKETKSLSASGPFTSRPWSLSLTPFSKVRNTKHSFFPPENHKGSFHSFMH